MLSINKTGKIALSVVAMSAAIVPTTIFALNNINSAKDTFATAMPAGFNDQNFYDCVLAEFMEEFPEETVASSGLTDSQLAKIRTLDCNGEGVQDDKKITDLSGLQKMSTLIDLKLHSNKISRIDVTSNTNLYRIDVSDNQLSSIDVRSNPNLMALALYDNKIESLDISRNTELTQLAVYRNLLTSLDTSNNTKLLQIYAQENSLTSVSTSNNTALTLLVLSDNELTSVNLENNTELTTLYLHNNLLTDLDVSKNTMLGLLSANGNKLTSVNLENNTELTMLYLHNNLLTDLDVSKNTMLEALFVHNNNLTRLDISNNPDLLDFKVDNILISAGIEDEDLVNGQKTFDLSGLKFISTDGNTTIANTANYTFDNASKILSVKDIAATNGFVITSPIDTSLNNSEYRQYKLQIGKVAPDDSEDPGEDEDTDNPSQGDDDSASDGKDVVVPDTSAKTDGGKTTEATGAKTPNTGVTTKDDEDTASLISYLLPVLALTVVLLLAYAGGRKVFARKRINF